MKVHKLFLVSVLFMNSTVVVAYQCRQIFTKINDSVSGYSEEKAVKLESMLRSHRTDEAIVPLVREFIDANQFDRYLGLTVQLLIWAVNLENPVVRANKFHYEILFQAKIIGALQKVNFQESQ